MCENEKTNFRSEFEQERENQNEKKKINDFSWQWQQTMWPYRHAIKSMCARPKIDRSTKRSFFLCSFSNQHKYANNLTLDFCI